MAELWDIARFVEENPDDHDQRWRLAKKLYNALEYRLAADHLEILKNEWEPRVNVVRYLAATYYRLGRHSEAIKVLEDGLEIWPQESGLYEQLARVLEVAGEREHAADVWEKLAELDPKHRLAARAAKRLRRQVIQESAEQDLHLAESDSGIDLSPGRICPNCGSQNSDEFERCWHCNTALSGIELTPAPGAPRPGRPVFTPEMIGVMGGVVVVALLSLCLYLSLRLLLRAGPELVHPGVICTLAELYRTELATTRILMGIVLLVGWPMALWGALLLVPPTRPLPVLLVNLSGLLLAALAYLGTWLPGGALALAPILPALVSLAIVAVAFGMGFGRALKVWVVQLAFVFAFTVVSVVIIESFQSGRFFNPVTSAGAVLHLSGTAEEGGNRGSYEVPLHELPVVQGVRWPSTGSPWLDERAGPAGFVVTTPPETAGLKFEIKDSTGTRAYDEIAGGRWTRTFPVKPGETYEIIVRGPAGAEATVEIRSLIPPRFLSSPASAASPAS